MAGFAVAVQAAMVRGASRLCVVEMDAAGRERELVEVASWDEGYELRGAAEAGARSAGRVGCRFAVRWLPVAAHARTGE